AGVGVWASSVTRNQITAFILAVTVTFGLILVGLDPLVVGLPPQLGAIVASLGVLSHFSSIARGVIDLRDAVYFVSLAVLFLVFAYFALLARKVTPQGEALKRLRLGTALLAAGVLVVDLFGRHSRGRQRRVAGGPHPRHPTRAVQRAGAGRAPGKGRVPGARRALRRRGEDHAVPAADQRSRVPAHVRHPGADPPRKDGHRLRRDRRRGLGAQPTRLRCAARAARQPLRCPPVRYGRHDDRPGRSGHRRRRDARLP